MFLLLTIALAPVAILLVYVYFRDKYEKEPISLLLWGLFLGALVTVPIMVVEFFLDRFAVYFQGMGWAAYRAFVVAGFTEEIFKFLVVMLFFWRKKDFNEKFDGIVYAVFVSLGFAAVENILYVIQNGSGTGLIRAVTAVPAHLLFGVIMGYYIGLAKFIPEGRTKFLQRAVYMPVLMHGFYDFMIFSQHWLLLLLFAPYILYMWRTGLRRMKELSIAPDQEVGSDPEEDRSNEKN